MCKLIALKQYNGKNSEYKVVFDKTGQKELGLVSTCPKLKPMHAGSEKYCTIGDWKFFFWRKVYLVWYKKTIWICDRNLKGFKGDRKYMQKNLVFVLCVTKFLA